MDISWKELLWEGETIDGEFMRGQLFRFNGHYYICNNVPYTLGDCWEMSLTPPLVGQWHEIKLDTLKKCEWEIIDTEEN